MSKTIRAVTKKISLIVILAVMVAYSLAAYHYGNLNIFGSPHRVIIQGFRYDNDNTFKTLTGENKPMYEVSTLIERLTGKRIYSNQKNFKLDFGTRVYLYIKGDEYIELLCGGGA